MSPVSVEEGKLQVCKHDFCTGKSKGSKENLPEKLERISVLKRSKPVEGVRVANASFVGRKEKGHACYYREERAKITIRCCFPGFFPVINFHFIYPCVDRSFPFIYFMYSVRVIGSPGTKERRLATRKIKNKKEKKKEILHCMKSKGLRIVTLCLLIFAYNLTSLFVEHPCFCSQKNFLLNNSPALSRPVRELEGRKGQT